MRAIKINQLLPRWLTHVTLPIASFKLHPHESFGDQRGKLKIKRTVEGAEGERKGREDEFSDEI